MELNREAIEKMMNGSFGTIPAIDSLFNQLAEMVVNSDAGDGKFTLAWHSEEKGLIPEIIIRVRKPEEQ